MSNAYYTVSGNPGTGSPGQSAPIRAEFLAQQTAWDILVPGIFTVGFSLSANVTMTLPGVDATLMGEATTNTMTGKTFDTAGSGNVFKINGTAISAVIGTGAVVLATGPTVSLATGSTGVTQASYNNSTSLATTAYVAGELAQKDVVATTSGTSTAYVLTYSPAVTSLVDGMSHLVHFHANCGDSPTLNVDSRGALPLKFFCNSWAAVVADMIAGGAIYRVSYDQATASYWVHGLEYKITVTAAAAAHVDFTNIPSVINDLTLGVECTLDTNGEAIGLRTYGADGVLDTGVTDYYGVALISNSSLAAPTIATGTASRMFLGSSMWSGDYGFSCRATAAGIQNSSRTKFNFSSQYGDSGGSDIIAVQGSSDRQEADRISGVRVLVTSGTFTGTVTITGK